MNNFVQIFMICLPCTFSLDCHDFESCYCLKNYDACNRRPLYTPAPEGLLSFGQFSPMNMYNFQPPSMHHHDQGNQRMEDLHFVGTSPHDSFSTPPPPPHPKDATWPTPNKVKSTTSKKKRKVINVDDDEPSKRTAQRLSYTPEEHVRLVMILLAQILSTCI